MSVSTHDPVPRTRKPRGQGASRRGEILRAATRIFAEEGVANATMRRIAGAVGLSTTGLYVYFPDKDKILQAIAEMAFAELLQALERSSQGLDPETGLRAGMRAYIEFGLAHPDVYRLIFLSRRSGPQPCDDIPAAVHSFDILHHGIEAMMAAGQFRPGSAAVAAEAAWACLHGVTALLLDQRRHLDTPPEQLIEAVIDTVIAANR